MAGTEFPLLSITLTPAAAVTAYRGVGYDGAQIAVAGAKIAGIARTAALAGASLSVIDKGIAIVEVGAAVAIGDALTMDAQGRAVTATSVAIAAGATAVTSAAANGAADITGGVLPQYVFGDARQAASAAGQLIEVMMR
jgi:hypothetical protein